MTKPQTSVDLNPHQLTIENPYFYYNLLKYNNYLHKSIVGLIIAKYILCVFNLKEHQMTIYQVINKQNQLEYAYLDYEVAIEEVAKLNENCEANCFSINAIEDEDF